MTERHPEKRYNISSEEFKTPYKTRVTAKIYRKDGVKVELNYSDAQGDTKRRTVKIPDNLNALGEAMFDEIEKANQKFLDAVGLAENTIKHYHFIATGALPTPLAHDRSWKTMRILMRQVMEGMMEYYGDELQWALQNSDDIDTFKLRVQEIQNIERADVIEDIHAQNARTLFPYHYAHSPIEKNMLAMKDVFESECEAISAFMEKKHKREEVVMGGDDFEAMEEREKKAFDKMKDAVGAAFKASMNAWFDAAQSIRSSGRPSRQEGVEASKDVKEQIERAARKYAAFKLQIGYLPLSTEALHHSDETITTRDTFDKIEDMLHEMKKEAASFMEPASASSRFIPAPEDNTSARRGR